MQVITVRGGRPLFGEIPIDGMKNSALPILFATLLIGDRCILRNLPPNADVESAIEILRSRGVHIVMQDPHTAEIDARSAHPRRGDPSEREGQMRASYYLVGAELARFGVTRVGYPGGCDFGGRPIDQHEKGLSLMGAALCVTEDEILGRCDGGLAGAEILPSVVSVGVTIHLMLAAVTAVGDTIIRNAAKEPHVVDVANFLNACGGKIEGAGSDVITVHGVRRIHGCDYTIAPDMIEAGTYMIAAAATGGELTLTGASFSHLDALSAVLTEMGVTVTGEGDRIGVHRHGRLFPASVQTAPYPGFPTDLQPQLGALMCLADGVSTLKESVFDHRFRYCTELEKMGAKIKIKGDTAQFFGGRALHAASLSATDLRGGAAMLIAALTVAEESVLSNVSLIRRGYADLERKLSAVGAILR